MIIQNYSGKATSGLLQRNSTQKDKRANLNKTAITQPQYTINKGTYIAQNNENKAKEFYTQNTTNTDTFAQQNDMETELFQQELELYEKHKHNPLQAPYEDKKQLRDLLKLLEDSKITMPNLSKEEREIRDLLIDKIENFFDTEEMQGKLKQAETMVSAVRQNAQTANEQAEAMAKRMKEIRTCLEIASKIRKGTASNKEMRYLLKKDPKMYAMAMAVKQLSEKEDKAKNKTTTDIEDDDESGASNNNMLGNIQGAVTASSAGLPLSGMEESGVSAADFM